MIRFNSSKPSFLHAENRGANENVLSPTEQIRRLAIHHGLLHPEFPQSSLVDVMRTARNCDPGSVAVQNFIAELNVTTAGVRLDKDEAEQIEAFKRAMDAALYVKIGEGLTRCAIVQCGDGNPKSSVFAALLDCPELAIKGVFGRAQKELTESAAGLKLENESDCPAFSAFMDRAAELNPGLTRRLYTALAKQTTNLEKICFDAMRRYVRDGDADMMKSVFMCVGRLPQDIQYATWVSLIEQVCAWPDQYHESVAEILFLRPLSTLSEPHDGYERASALFVAAQGFSDRSPEVAVGLKAISCYILAYARKPGNTVDLGMLYRSLILLPDEMQELPSSLKQHLAREGVPKKTITDLLDLLIAAPQAAVTDDIVLAAIGPLLRHAPRGDSEYLEKVGLLITEEAPYSDAAFSDLMQACEGEVDLHAKLLQACSNKTQVLAWEEKTDLLPPEEAELARSGDYRRRMKYAWGEMMVHNENDAQDSYFDDLSSLTSNGVYSNEDADSSIGSIDSNIDADLLPRLLGRPRRRPDEN